MRKLACWAFLFAANLSGTSFAAGLDALEGAAEATLSWRLQFGTGELRPGYALAVGYRGHELSGKLLEIDVSDAHALARLAGVPMLDRGYRMNQGELAAEPAAAAGSQPWYARKWVWWTTGAVAATLAMTGGDGTVEYNHDSGNTTSSRDGCAGVSANHEDTETGCIGTEGGSVVGTNEDGDLCAIYGFGDEIPDACVPTGLVGRAGPHSYERTDTSWLDAGTGQMGDLVAASGR